MCKKDIGYDDDDMIRSVIIIRKFKAKQSFLVDIIIIIIYCMKRKMSMYGYILIGRRIKVVNKDTEH